MKKGNVAGILLPLLVGLAGLMRVAKSPGYDAIRSVDVVRLLGSGACFGVSLVWIILTLRGRTMS